MTHRPSLTLDDCTFETMLAGGIALYDASHLMPRWAPKREFRDVAKIDRLFFHHSGRLGLPGVMGAWSSANYVVNQRKTTTGRNKGKLARFPGPAYTYWIPAEDLLDHNGNLVVLRLNEDRERSYHTGSKANDFGIAAVFQGNTTTKPLTHSHEECAEALIPWTMERHPLIRFPSMHSEADEYGGRSKLACPGVRAEAWIRGWRRGLMVPAPLAA